MPNLPCHSGKERCEMVESLCSMQSCHPAILQSIQIMILHIDTTQREELIVQLLDESNKVIAEHKSNQGFNHAQNLLPAIEDLLHSNNSSIKEVAKISVNPGPGSFTGTRVGVAVANALSFALNVPVNELPVGQARPVYDREPNISQPKTEN